MFNQKQLVSVLALLASFTCVSGVKVLKSGLPARTLGMYTLLADDSHANYTSETEWQPRLYEYQIRGANVLWFTFINPQNMSVPKSFSNLTKCRGQDGCPTRRQLIIFSIGGQLYSEQPWPWLATTEAAQSMAATVATWFERTSYNIDGIDIDIEGTAGDANVNSTLLDFIVELRNILSKKLTEGVITVPVYGSPQIAAEIDVVNAAWSPNGACHGMVDSIGIMVYNDSDSLRWVANYTDATSASANFPIKCDVPSNDVIVGIQGTASSSAIANLTNSVIEQNLGGIMVWYASVYDATNSKAGLTYGGGASDASTTRNETGSTWVRALRLLQKSTYNL